MGQRDATCTDPHHAGYGSHAYHHPAVVDILLIVALQAAFERQTLKPVFHLIGYRLWVLKIIGYGLCVNLIQRAEPHLIRVQRRVDGQLIAPVL
jgi:hypothetical protein